MRQGGQPNSDVRRRRRPTYRRPFQELILTPWVIVPLATVMGLLVVLQAVSPNPRLIKLFLAMFGLIAIVRLPLSKSVVGFIYVFSVPTFVFVGDSNTLLIGALLLTWLAQIAIRREPRPRASPIDWSMGVYLLAMALPFISVETELALRRGVQEWVYLASGVGLFLLLYNTIRTEHQLRRIVNALLVVTVFVEFTALLEYFFDGYQLVPEWFLHKRGSSHATADRVGSVLGNHALFSDFCAFMFMFQVMYAVRAKTFRTRMLFVGCAILSVVALTMAVNRGGLIAWMLGVGYLLFLMRGRVNWIQVLGVAPVIVGVVFLWQRFVTGDNVNRIRVIGRLAGTQIERGWVPDTRVQAWAQILERIPEHLWVGHGLFYELGMRGGTEGTVWPHSAYLMYLYTSGVIGVLVWGWILVRVMRITFPGFRADLARCSFAEATGAIVHIQIVMFAVGQMRTSHQRGNTYVYIMWILFALGAITWKMTRARRASGANPTVA